VAAMRILVVDDDPPSVKMISFLLREEGYDVVSADNGLTALELVDREVPDLVILDVMMPNLDGFEVCRRMRQRADVPIIFLSAKGETTDKVAGLQLGADDYLAKPFEPSELLARVKAVMRRAEAYAGKDATSELMVGDLRLDPVTNQATFSDGRSVELTPIEFRLLYCLMRNAGRILSHDLLLSAVWGYDYEGYSNQLAVYIRRLRMKIEQDPNDPKLLTTLRGLGYKFERT
jgi:DNA-binding response OmpR family regulator